MSQNAINYLQENKNAHSKEVLIQQLRVAGYDAADITESVAAVYENNNLGTGNAVPMPETQNKVGFLDFSKTVDYNQNSSLKFRDFFTGLLGPFILTLVFSMIPLFGMLVMIFVPIGIIIGIIVLFKKRKYISYGLIMNLVAVAGLITYFISSF